MSYITEFPDYDDDLYRPDGWQDQSWHNDTCPHIEKRIDTTDTEIAVKVWQDYKDKTLRELDFGKRYSFIIEVNGFYVFSYETDDLEKIKELMEHVDIDRS